MYRVFYWLGVSAVFGFRIAKFILTVASKRRMTTHSGLSATAHAVRHLRGAPAMKVNTVATLQRTGGKLLSVQPMPVPGAVADRIHTVDLYNGSVLLGALWMYLYPEKKIARRVFKVQDRHLASAIGFSRYYYADVPYDEVVGVGEIVKAFNAEVSKQLDQRLARAEKARTRERQAAEVEKKPSPAAVQQRPPSAAIDPQPKKDLSASVVAPTPAPSSDAAPAPALSVVAPSHARQVKGEAVVGAVSQAGMTKKYREDGSAYQTYCLTIHDGSREVPFFGQELARQVGDMNIQPGERIRVVFMGKQSMPIEGKPTRYKNLYQITRVNA